jgi:hypothetical protein
MNWTPEAALIKGISAATLISCVVATDTGLSVPGVPAFEPPYWHSPLDRQSWEHRKAARRAVAGGHD